MGLFLVIVGTFTFATATLEEAKDICAPDPITVECYVEALEPIEEVDYSKLNG